MENVVVMCSFDRFLAQKKSRCRFSGQGNRIETTALFSSTLERSKEQNGKFHCKVECKERCIIVAGKPLGTEEILRKREIHRKNVS